MNLRRKKLLLFGALERFPAEVIALFNAFKTRVEADGGEIADENFIKRFYTAVVETDAVDFCNDHSIIFLPEARRVESGRVNKLYALFGNDRDISQTSAAFQPEVSPNTRNGRQFILCEDGRGLNDGRRVFLEAFSASKSFLEISGVFKSDDETAGNINILINIGTTTQGSTVRARLGHTNGGVDDNTASRRLNSDSLVQVSVTKIDDYKLLSGRFRYDLGQLRLFRNNAFVQANDNLSQGLSDERNGSFAFGQNYTNTADRCLNGDAGFTYCFNDNVPSALQDALGEFAMKEYNLPA